MKKFVFVLMSLLSINLHAASPEKQWPALTRVVIVWNSRAVGPEAIDQSSLSSMIDSIGIKAQKIGLAGLSEKHLSAVDILIVPAASAKLLRKRSLETISQFVDGGGFLLTDGDSSIASSLGIRLGNPEPVKRAYNASNPSAAFNWADTPAVQPITASSDLSTVIYKSSDTGHALAVVGTKGKGRYLFFSPLIDPISSAGYSRFPDLLSFLLEENNLSPLLQRRFVEAYFDPGVNDSHDFEALAKVWKHSGIRTIYAATWTGEESDRLDFDRLIRAAHRNGILVYAWLEWPHVDWQFWEQHPEWREKTATHDAHIDWRYLMNLKNPECMQAVLNDLDTLLKNHDWDGVNIAEIYFEPVIGPSNPDSFTPMNADVRADFKRTNGFDPIDLFSKTSPYYWEINSSGLQKFFAYRRQLANEILEAGLKNVQQLNQNENHHWEIVTTVIDTLAHPEYADFLGIDIHKNISLAHEYGATVQVEDPFNDWNKPPSRYIELGQRYEKLLPHRDYIIDVNIVPIHAPTQLGFATEKAQGTEVTQLAQCAGMSASRVCFYAESELLDEDWRLMPFAGVGEISFHRRGNGARISSPYSFTLHADPRSVYKLDGRPWPCQRSGEVSIPPGVHKIQSGTPWKEMLAALVPSDLTNCREEGDSLVVDYNASSRCPIFLKQNPVHMRIDGNDVPFTAAEGEKDFIVYGPPGKHQIKLYFQ